MATETIIAVADCWANPIYQGYPVLPEAAAIVIPLMAGLALIKVG